METFLQKNLKSLAAHPNLLFLVEGISKKPSTEKYVIDTAKTGLQTLTVCSADGKAFSLHSKYDPLSEAKKQVENSFSNQSHVLLFGMGLGYMIDFILEKTASLQRFQKIIVVEPDPFVFMAALQARDFSNILTSRKIEWCVGINSDDFGEKWNQLLDWAIVDSISIIEHPPSLARFQTYFERIKEKIRYFSNRSKGNIVTLMHTGSDFHTNYFRNTWITGHFPGIGRLFGKFAEIPCVIVGAGPSLEKNSHLLKEIKNRFLIIATDTAFRQLKVRNIKPDIVCAADPCYENSLDFVGVEDEKDVYLAVEPMTHPDIINSFRGPKFIMTFGGGLSPWLEPHREPIGKLSCWGSIATTTFDLARNLGCNPIIFIGQDLSFQDGKLYARGSYSDDLFMDKVHKFSSLEHEISDYIATRGIHRFQTEEGETLFTDPNMYLYKEWFEDQFRQTPDKTVINATEGGILKNYVKLMPLKEAINKYLPSQKDIGKILFDAFSPPLSVDLKAIEEKLKNAKRDLDENRNLSKYCQGLLKKLKRRNEDITIFELSGDVKSSYLEIAEIHDKICEKKELFSWFSIHQTKFVTKHSMLVNGLKQNPNSKFSDWIETLNIFFEAILRFYDYQMPLINFAIDSLQKH
ncbi:MAG: motility associated factor glycosyltransferase family protein [Candidatus Riflebacteria bacterium]|nr:motility associated factor glycosyltransferase family protein [Candidatus Riflebacteria bacterium]